MKKNLTFLTGIVILITILVAAGCGSSEKKNSPAEEGIDPVEVGLDSKTVTIYLKDTVIGESMHLLMYHEKNSDCGVIDNLQTVVYREDIIVFKKADNSQIKKVDTIRLVEEKVKVFNVVNSMDRGLYALEIDSDAPEDTIVKYVIEFAINKDTSYIIDPYLRIPKQQ